MLKKNHYYGGCPPLGRIITLYRCFDSQRGPQELSPQLQQQIINAATVANTYTLNIGQADITFFNFLLGIKQFIDPNLNVRVAIQIWANNPNVNSPLINNLMRPSDNIPQSNIFFIKVAASDTIFSLRVIPNLHTGDFPLQVHRNRKLRPASLYWNHPENMSREYSNYDLCETLYANNFNQTNIYLQGLDLSQPNVKTLENFVRLFYSLLGNSHL